MSEKILADRYRLVDQIGIGGMAIVYRAIDMRTGHNVAVKVLKPEFNQDVEFVSRFQREAEAASKMTHHNIVNLLDVGMDGSNRYLVIEYVNGQTLKQLIQEKGRLNAQLAGQITIRILSALQHAHSNGIIHRDIKPQNILVNAEGHVKVADFGIARMADSSTLTKGDSVMGSVHYFSPEQARGEVVTEAGDLYSVGVVLYEMLTGRVPFDGDSPIAIAMQQINAIPTPIELLAPDCPPAIIRVCGKAMSKNPAFRYQSATEMATDLRLAMSGQSNGPLVDPYGRGPIPHPQAPIPNRPPVPPQPGPKGTKGKNKGLSLILTILLAVMVGAGLYFGTTAIVNRITSTVSIADVVGMDATAAQRTLSRSGLNTEIVSVNNAVVSAGLVVTQSPEAETSIHKGETVVLTVSAGPGTQSVPSVVGYTVQDAISALQVSGLTLAVIERLPSADVPEDAIISQSPEAGATALSGDIVQVSVSGGSSFVPNLLEMTMPEVRESIAQAGLTLNGEIQYEIVTDPALHNRVAAQNPAPGTQVVRNAPVSLQVYRVTDMVHTEQLTLSLPESSSTMNVKVTLANGGSENLIYAADIPPESSRHPVVEVVTDEEGDMVCKVYINDAFTYQQTITIE